jgi:chitinase
MRLISRPAVFIAVAVSLLGQTTVMASGLDAWLAAHPISTVTRTVTSSVPKPTSSNIAPSAFTRCPTNCSDAGYDPASWDAYHSVARLALCNQAMLLDFSLYNSLDDNSTHTSIRSCTADSQNVLDTLAEKKVTSASFSPGITVPMLQSNATLQLAWIDADNDKKGSTPDVTNIVQQIDDFLGAQSTGKEGISFALAGETVVGVFAGSQIQQQGLVPSILQDFVAEVKDRGISDSLFVQLCGETRSSKYALGLVASVQSDISFVQSAVKTWKEGKCVTSFSGSSAWKSITLSVPSSSTSSSNSTIRPAHTTNLTSRTVNALHPRTACSVVEVYFGDTCTSLASECDITLAEFEDYNPSSTMCSTPSSLMPGQHVCCSSGTLPDFAPQPYSNGTCYTYLVQTGDSCSDLAATWSLTVDEVESYNNDTWGWMGCGDMQANNNICLSSGSPPMPASIANAVCGPQVVGTPAAPSGTNLSTLNECPLNACCDIWGQCGTTSEFCTITQSTTGAPGTAAENTNGCISNCGTDIIISDAPALAMKVGYFEGFDTDRPCLNEAVLDIDYSQYTHIHLGFGAITSDFGINVTAISSQFDMLLDLPDVKKILSIGGWSFSTDPSTYQLFREAVLPLNQVTFIDNIVAFVDMYGLDGIDFDWEYPGEPDIPGIPAGSELDGIYYWEFLTLLKSALNDEVPDATVSIAAPASYWYLKAFPIEAISAAVDYIIFMTYDLHGQWDYGNANADIGCPAGNCLRSDVNLTETVNALSMITKAGVPSNKIVVGVTSYGRSFQMTEAGCYGPMCTYVGPSSGAYPGICTNTAGYLGNAEIAYMNATMSSSSSYLDDDSYSNILVFDETQWVSYMDDDNKAVRAALYEAYNFAGTTDWAIDLQGTAQSLIDVCGEPTSSAGAPALCVSSEAVTCIAGTGDTDYKDLCNFTCNLDYCPSPCTCTANGTANPLPVISASTVYACPATGLDISYSSLCSFACKYGYCPIDYCTVSDSSLCTGLVLDQVNATLPRDFLTNQSNCADLQNCGFISPLQNLWASLKSG